MGTQESLSMPDRFESSHPSLSYPVRLMRLFGPVVLILFGTVDCLGHQLSKSKAVASQFIGHDLPRLLTVTSQQTLEKPLG